ncbi:single-stranded DNA-binding protein [Lentimicrobium sp. S6]|uniref:single-stranded DNA-binding protein n=1 Tax=Lentimicrobium sp. S6 TaxID=2735872 RepID=UPI0015547C64|nr:single-stranded DNA-binding protein [Lentimicrobium sp. S6]NPD48077.1 single-stranded DNA-binding protein [Lentimicrobium sp. S6]
MQNLVVVGNVGKDAEVRVTESGDKAISFNVATNKKYVDKDGVLNEVVTWFNCSKWVKKGGSVELAKYLLKGTTVSIIGEVSAHGYAGENGKPKASLDVRVSDLELISSKKEN